MSKLYKTRWYIVRRNPPDFNRPAEWMDIMVNWPYFKSILDSETMTHVRVCRPNQRYDLMVRRPEFDGCWVEKGRQLLKYLARPGTRFRLMTEPLPDGIKSSGWTETLFEEELPLTAMDLPTDQLEQEVQAYLRGRP